MKVYPLLKKAFFVPALGFLLFWGKPAVPAQANTVEPVLARIVELLSALEFDSAIALFDTIPRPERDSSNIRVLEASVLSSAGKYDEARAVLRLVSQREPNNTDALFVLSAIEGAEGRNSYQRDALERIISIDADHFPAQIALGNLNLSSRSLRGRRPISAMS